MSRVVCDGRTHDRARHVISEDFEGDPCAGYGDHGCACDGNGEFRIGTDEEVANNEAAESAEYAADLASTIAESAATERVEMLQEYFRCAYEKLEFAEEYSAREQLANMADLVKIMAEAGFHSTEETFEEDVSRAAQVMYRD